MKRVGFVLLVVALLLSLRWENAPIYSQSPISSPVDLITFAPATSKSMTLWLPVIFQQQYSFTKGAQ